MASRLWCEGRRGDLGKERKEKINKNKIEYNNNKSNNNKIK